MNIKSTSFVLFTLFIGSLLVSSFASDYPMRALLNLNKIITPFIFAHVLIQVLLEDTSFLFQFYKGIKTAAIIAIVFILIQLVVGPDRFTFYSMLNQNVNLSGNEKIRYPGMFMDAQINGIFLGMVSFVWLFNFKDPGKLKFRNLVFFALMIGGLLLSGSRSPMLGVAAALGFLIITLKGNLRVQVAGLVLAGGLLVLFAFFTTDLFTRFTGLDESLQFRQNIWRGAWDIFNEQPVLGIGMDNYLDYVKLHAQDQSIILDDNEILYLNFPENGYLKLLVEWGIISTFIFALILFKPFFEYILYFFKGYDLRIASVAAATVVCWLVTNISVFTLSDSRIIILLTISFVMMSLFTKKEIEPGDAG